ncbi:DUF4331 domain-containing protein [Angustibacter luteus]|uniref:DUF4331 domain-containing protein n=1 Tax=Angustibacter luteus TaxID=658456 RepID=A0ABW1JH33_9ACTN
MSSHREAPEISKDPVADSSDLYAFVDPEQPRMVTILANYVPLQDPAGGPNFFEFGDDVRYAIHVSNGGDARTDLTFALEFTTHVRNRNTFLYNTGPVDSLDSPNLNRYQTYTLTREAHGRRTVLAKDVPVAPANVGPRSMPAYRDLSRAAIRSLPGGGTVFAGPRADGFYVDLGSVFDLLALRPFQNLHRFRSPAAKSVNTLAGLNVHTIALRLPISSLTRDGSTPREVNDARSVIGVYTSASRRRARLLDDNPAHDRSHGSWQQVSRLGNPLFNEVLVPMVRKDAWNRSDPEHDRNFAQGVLQPEVSALLPVLYPDVFPRLAAYTKPRADLAAILLTGLPSGVVDGLQTFTGTRQADLLRLNVAIRPSAKPSPLGVLGGDLAGFPNGRRPIDDVFTIELRALAGLTIPLVDPAFTPDDAAGLVTDQLETPTFKSSFPYLATPHDGYSAHTAAAS